MRRLAGRGRDREHPAPFRGLIREDNHQAGDDDDDDDDDKHDDEHDENDDVDDYLRVMITSPSFILLQC